MGTGKLLNKSILWLAVIYFGLLFVDVSVSRLYNLLVINVELMPRVSAFLVICVFFIVLPPMFLYFIKNNAPLIKRYQIGKLNTFAWIFQFVLSIIALIILIEVMFYGQYDVSIASSAEILGLLGSSVLLVVLSILFLKSFNLNKSSLLFSYMVSSGFASFNCALVGLFALIVLSHKPFVVSQLAWTSSHVILQTGSLGSILGILIRYTSIVSFILLWVSTSLLLKHQIRGLHPIAFISLIISPFIFLISPLLSQLTFINLAVLNDPLFYGSIVTTLYTVSPVIGGVVFGLSYYLIAKKIPTDNRLKIYMVIAGHGFIIFLISSQYNILLYFPYPPFGFISLSSAFLGSYMILTGIYFTTISSLQSTRIHDHISKIIRENSKIFHEMSTALVFDEIQSEVKKIEVQLEDETDIPLELGPEEIRDLVAKALEETKRK